MQFHAWICGISAFIPIMRNFLDLINSSIMIPLIVSTYVFDESSMYPFLTILPCVMIIQGHNLIRGAMKFQTYKDRKYQNFVTLIGRHDCLFLYVVFSMFVFVYNLLDMFATAYEIGYNLWYLLFSFYIINCAMDEKLVSKTFLLIKSRIGVFVYCAIYLTTLQATKNPLPKVNYEKLFPLKQRDVDLKSQCHKQHFEAFKEQTQVYYDFFQQPKGTSKIVWYKRQDKVYKEVTGIEELKKIL